MPFWKRDRRNRDLDEEIAHDLALDAAERMREGATPEDAARASMRDFGNVALTKEDTRAAWGWRWIDVLKQDLRYAARTLRRSPGFAATAIVALAMGIGVNSAVFTIFDQIALRPIPGPDGDRLVGIYESFHGRFSRTMFGNIHMLSYPEAEYYAQHNHSFTAVAAYAPARGLTLAGDPPEKVSGWFVSAEYFRVFNGRTALGRTPLPEEFATTHAVVVISYPFWQRRFGGDSAIVGSTVRFAEIPCTVIGVLAPEFKVVGPDAGVPDVFLPIAAQADIMPTAAPLPRDLRTSPQMSWLNGVAKLKPGVSPRQAQADLAVLAAQLDRESPGRVTEITVLSGGMLMNPEARTVMFAAGTVILLVVGLVLLVACANVANLLLARAAGRQREIAVRLSMGASRGRLVRQLLTESAVIALAGGGLGLLLARWTVRVGYSVMAARFTLVPMDFTLDANILLYTLLLSGLASLMFGLLPALQATTPDLFGALKDEGAFWGRRMSGTRLRGALVSGEIAVSVVFLLATALLVRGVMRIQSFSDDLHLDKYMVTTLNLRMQRYDAARAAEFHRSLRAALDSLPGVASALTLVPPFRGVAMTEVRTEGQSDAEPTQQLNFEVVSAEYFDVMGIRPIRGRTFTAAEAERGDTVAVVSEAMAKRYWPGQDAIGRRFRTHAQTTMLQVVGVVPDLRSIHVWEMDGPLFYRPIGPKDALFLNIISREPRAGFLPVSTIRRMVRAVDPTLLPTIGTLADNVDHELSAVRVGAAVAALLGGLALLLALAGIYCVVMYSVSQRTREIGIRMTLGAERGSVIRLMLTDNLRPVLIGMGIGLAAGAAVAAAVAKSLVGVQPLDPIAFAAVAVFLPAVALLASYIPARRATRVDPAIALRYE
jgi:macrolide transport system ATP-binding/permease protein